MQVCLPEQTNRNCESPNTSRSESLLWLQLALLVELRFDIAVKIPEERRNRDNGADENTDERDALHAETEIVDTHEDDGKGLEPDVEETVNKSDVEIEEEDHGFCEIERKRSDQCYHCNLLGCH